VANENIARSIIRALRERGHDVLSVKESMRGAGDKEIMDHARAESRLILTYDKDFGELAFRQGLSAQCGVILLRVSGAGPEITNKRVLEAIDSRSDWPGHFAVITDHHIKLRSLAASQ